MSLEGHGTEATSSEIKTTLSYRADASKLHVEGKAKSYPDIEEDVDGKLRTSEPVQENGVVQPKRAAKIHDFCFGIPYGKCASIWKIPLLFTLLLRRDLVDHNTHFFKLILNVTIGFNV